ncbi:MAG: hypothetical protein II041_06790 [Bacteroidales bacterium]|nr:hypothetical protein [Bacteroidales bacterium]
MKDGKYIHYQTWNMEHPVALRFRFTEIAMTKKNLEELKEEIETALKNLK